MKESIFKDLIRILFFPLGSTRKIFFGSMQGMRFRVGPITGLSPWYSGTERAQQAVFKKLIRKGDRVMDIGANWGLHTLYFSKLVGPEGCVISVEPLPQVYDEMRWHIQANHCANVKPIRIAMGNFDGTEQFVQGMTFQTGSLSTVYHSNTSKKRIQVTLRSLDSLVKELNIKSLRLVKIDVEGAESEVLNGAKKTIEFLKPYLMIELHTPQQDVQVAQFLINLNYQFKRVSTGPPILKVNKGWPERTGVWGTILAIPPS